MGTIRNYFLQMAGVSLFFLWGFSFSVESSLRLALPGLIPPLRDRRRKLAGIFRRYLDTLCKWKLLVIEEHPDIEHLNEQPGTIFVANHPGLFDALLIVSRFPNCACLMRAGLMKHPCMGGAARWCEFIPNDSGADFIRKAVKKLRDRENVLIFPEGTRTDPGNSLNPFKKGFALVAAKSGAPVQTLLLRQTGTLLKKGTPLTKPATFPVSMCLHEGERFQIGKGESAAAFANRIEEYFRSRVVKQP